MKRNLFLFLSLILSGFASAQKFTHIAKVHYVKFTNKEISMIGYDLGIRRMSFSIAGGIGTGTDDQFIAVENLENGKSVQMIRASQTIYPITIPANTYLESCNSTYKVQQLRLGFTAFARRNDTLGRHPGTGPHFGVEAIASKIIESQTVIYKSETDESRFNYSGINNFNTFGAGTQVGWQFAFFKEHLYIDLRAAIVFYYPFMPEPNLNSPFAGNRFEFQGSIGWNFYRTKKQDVKDSGKDQIREKI